MQTQKDVAANTTENDDEEETTSNIETDPFFSGTQFNIFFVPVNIVYVLF